MEPIEPGYFRAVMGHFVTGVTVLTTFDGSEPAGITVNALSSVSLEPPLVMVALDRRRFITPIVRSMGRYAVCILGEGQRALSECFANAPGHPGRDTFCGAAWTPGQTVLPILDGSIASLECTTVETFSAGDHDLFIARVDALSTGPAAPEPLLYFRRQYLTVDRATAATAEGTPEG